MDEREMKKHLELYMIEMMQNNLIDAYGRRPQDLFLQDIDIENPSEATRLRLTRLIDKIYRVKLAKIRR